MKMYCINLERSPDRKAHCEKLFASLKLNVQFWPATDGQKLTPPDNVRGCALSHLFIWRHILRQKINKPVLILEDDCQLYGASVFRALDTINYPHYDVYMLGYWNPNGVPDKRTQIDGKWMMIEGGDYRSTVAYVVNGAKASKKLLNHCPGNTHIDLEIYEAIREQKLHALFSAPIPCVTQGGFVSTIG